MGRFCVGSFQVCRFHRQFSNGPFLGRPFLMGHFKVDCFRVSRFFGLGCFSGPLSFTGHFGQAI